MPNRILKESICSSDTIDGLSWFEEVFFYRLIVNCDDFGRFDARPAVLKARLFPLKERITLKDVSNALSKLADIGIVRLYECDSKPYLYLPTWRVHQTPRAAKSKFPSPDEHLKSSEINCNQLQANAPVFVFDNRDTIFDNRESRIDSSAEPENPPPAQDVLITLQLNTGEEYPILRSYADEMQKLYPAADVFQSLQEMKAWLINNPERRKTKTGIKRFINFWLSKEQNKPKNASKFAKKQAPRELDSEELEAIQKVLEGQQ